MSHRSTYLSPAELIHSARHYVRSSETGRNTEYEPRTYIKAKEDGWDSGFSATRLPDLPPVRMRMATAPQGAGGGVSPRKPRPPQTARTASKNSGRRSKSKSAKRDKKKKEKDSLPDINGKKQKEKDEDAAAEKEAKRKRKKEREEERQRKEQEAKQATEEKKQQEADKKEADRKRKEQEKAEKDEARRKKDEEDKGRQRQAEEEKKRQQEEDAKKKKEEEVEAKRQQKEAADAAAAKKNEEDAARKKQQQEEEAAAKKKEEAERKKKEDADAEAKRKNQEEADARRKQEEEDEATAAEADEAARKKTQEEEDARKEQEEADAAAKAETEGAAAAADQEEQHQKDRAALEGDQEPEGRSAVEDEEKKEREEIELQLEGNHMKSEAAAAQRKKIEEAEVCTYCKEKILDDDYMQGDDLILHGKCVEAWEDENLGKCAHCKKPIKDEYVEYTLNEGTEEAETVELHEGECIERYKEAHLPKCPACEKTIPDGEGVEHEGQPYHAECVDNNDASLKINIAGGCGHCDEKLEDAEFERIGEAVVHNKCIVPYCEAKQCPVCKQCGKHIYEVKKSQDGDQEGLVEEASLVSHLRGGSDKVHADCVSAWTLASRPACKLCDEKILDDEATALNDDLEEDLEKGDLYHTECAEDEVSDKAKNAKLKEEEEAALKKPLGTCDHCKQDVTKATKHSSQKKSEEEGGGTILIHNDCLDAWKEASLPKCGHCKKTIDSDFVEVTLPDSDEVVPLHDGECAEAYQAGLAPKCTRCKEPITGDDGVELGGEPYHDTCADEVQAEKAEKCVQCNKPLLQTHIALETAPGSGVKVNVCDQACVDAYQAANPTICAGCDKPITAEEESQAVEVAGKPYHRNCGQTAAASPKKLGDDEAPSGAKLGDCLQCKEPVFDTEDHLGLEADEETGAEGGVVHEKCKEAFEQQNNPTCDHCEKPISGEYVGITIGDKNCTVHNECSDAFKKNQQEEQPEEEETVVDQTEEEAGQRGGNAEGAPQGSGEKKDEEKLADATEADKGEVENAPAPASAPATQGDEEEAQPGDEEYEA